MERLTNNWPQKLLALVLALIVWALAPTPGREGQTEIQFFVPLTYTNAPKDLIMTSQPLQAVSILVEVPARDLASIYPSHFQAVVDMEHTTEGTHRFKISRSDIKTPKNVRILTINPDAVDIKFEKAAERELVIHPVLIGAPAPGHVLQKVTMYPDRVRVLGSAEILDKLDQLETKALSIEGLNAEIEMFASIDWPEGIKVIEPAPDNYTARIQIGSEPTIRLFENIPLGLVNQVYVTQINPKSFSLAIRGPRTLVESMTIEDIQAFIDLKAYKPGKYKVQQPTLRLRPEIQIQKVWPPIDIWVLNQKIYE
ncbi:MAG: hypothetical protein A2527_06890 [Candidatus Lambdaproteobacteria bacterium RIFOXYD2_FULL_50_16]|uniref:YbbR-like domain-containing protein n=1 Tax=Candidatus Lambdaproteobacteria bacterium RIFOXYD2_FULL_50_16 TaxID=1817772 RepID=A0A1F6GBT0_9PROT|nr:MAG: hypothetical protein A2527_06890 [Candidatus Lambdaproteobacteria bacterium RIFOXYD2_FULL_50_16]